MRRFYSYGPVSSKLHFCVQRKELIENCLNNLIGDPIEGGHYFTIWAPRQTGKTWLMEQVKKEIEKRYGEQFVVGKMSMQGTILEQDDPVDKMLTKIPYLMRDTFRMKLEAPESWEDWTTYFSKDAGLFDCPVILFIDEFDSLPPQFIDRLVTLFRDMYLKRDAYQLHGLAMIGVRAVLGVESQRGSPFNIQRSLYVPNFTKEEVNDLFQQYIAESGQQVTSEVIDTVYESTKGQPGLVCWFGELLTEKYNPGKEKPVDMYVWREVHNKALRLEWNNTVLNLVKKARMKYTSQVLQLFGKEDILFNTREDWCSYLYMNGIIDSDTAYDEKGDPVEICRFSSPFVQQTLYSALTGDLVGDKMPILPLEILDELDDVFTENSLNLPALLRRYRDFLKRLKAKGINPFKEQPLRADLRITEAVGHFHLYAWIQAVLGRRCVVSPEFPTGNGKVDLHLRCGNLRGIVEVKSFVDMAAYKRSMVQ
ncbi:MAG TPA: AAA-like domain-containing protein, partial [Thermodesulfovibrionia bacterium]|nr:AAA-like domain-containing protein [Thermodesulfovibrionia bacterium]